MKIKFLFFLLFPALALASAGCMDNSWHLAKPFDSKEYHIVSHKIGNHESHCQCPCTKMSFDRGKCLECGHKHDIQPWIIIRSQRPK